MVVALAFGAQPAETSVGLDASHFCSAGGGAEADASELLGDGSEVVSVLVIGVDFLVDFGDGECVPARLQDEPLAVCGDVVPHWSEATESLGGDFVADDLELDRVRGARRGDSEHPEDGVTDERERVRPFVELERGAPVDGLTRSVDRLRRRELDAGVTVDEDLAVAGSVGLVVVPVCCCRDERRGRRARDDESVGGQGRSAVGVVEVGSLGGACASRDFVSEIRALNPDRVNDFNGPCRDVRRDGCSGETGDFGFLNDHEPAGAREPGGAPGRSRPELVLGDGERPGEWAVGGELPVGVRVGAADVLGGVGSGAGVVWVGLVVRDKTGIDGGSNGWRVLDRDAPVGVLFVQAAEALECTIAEVNWGEALVDEEAAVGGGDRESDDGGEELAG